MSTLQKENLSLISSWKWNGSFTILQMFTVWFNIMISKSQRKKVQN